jgi:hypothetical protein
MMCAGSCDLISQHPSTIPADRKNSMTVLSWIAIREVLKGKIERETCGLVRGDVNRGKGGIAVT